jgi:hypothetical protein
MFIAHLPAGVEVFLHTIAGDAPLTTRWNRRRTSAIAR